MVLDHLVVQQMGKNNEEGEIDSMLLHGAAALYESNEHGVAASDIQYTSQNVEELIDKVEADAEAEVNALREKDGAAAKEVDAADASKPKESMSFGFAKIWEADQNKLEELQEKEDRPEDSANAWQLVMENAEKERRARLADSLRDGRRVKRKAATVKYQLAGTVSDGNTPEKGKGRSQPKVKLPDGKQSNDSSDAEYALGYGQSDLDSDSITSFPDDLDDLEFAHRASNIRGLAAGKKTMSAKERRDIETARAMEQSAAASKLVPNVETPPVSGPNGILIPNAVPGPSKESEKPTFVDTPEQRAERKAKWKAHRERKQRKQQAKLLANGSGSLTFPTQYSSQNVHNGVLGTQSPLQHASNPAKIQAGQHALQYMFQILREFSMTHYITQWGYMALPEIPPAERKSIYLVLAQAVDEQLYIRGLERYFAQSETYSSASHVFECGAVVISDAPRDKLMPPLPVEGKRWKDQKTDSSAARPTYQQHLPSPLESPKLHPPPSGIAAPAALPPRPQSTYVIDKKPQKVRRSPTHSTGARPRRSLNPMQSQTCSYCGQAHSVRQCSEILTVVDLRTFRSAILESDEPEADKVGVISATVESAKCERQRDGLREIERLLDLHAAAGSPIPSSASDRGLSSAKNDPSLSNGKSVARVKHSAPPLHTSAPSSGSRGAAIVVEDDSDTGVEPTAKRPRTDCPPSSRKSRQHHDCCPICDSNPIHPAALCPIIQAGPASIMR